MSYKTLKKYKGDSNIDDALDEFESEMSKIIPVTSKIRLDMQFCKDNCDGYPKYVSDYRFFSWFNVIFKE